MTKFLVTARKWRPQKFEDVVGQEHITQTLKNSIMSGKIAHAFIFSGPRGIGKTSTARILAKSLNCPNSKDYNPCNQCEVCESITNGSNIDVIEIDGASNRRIDEIRTLRESTQYAPSSVKYKIYIIDEVHMLTNESFNALLKVLEEPPAHVIFIFATTDIHKVPATILSRCQRYEFRRLTTEEIKNHLVKIAQSEGIEYDDEALRFIARRADGAMRDAQSLFDQIVVYSNGKIILDDVKEILNIIDIDLFFRVSDAIKKQDIEEAFRIVNHVYYHGMDLNTFVNDLIEHFRNMLTVAVTNNTDLIEESEITKEHYKNSSQDFSVKDLLRILSFLSHTQLELRQSTNPKMKLEISLAQLIALPRSADVEELIQEIKKLKKNDSIAGESKKPEEAQSIEKKTSVTDDKKVKNSSTSQLPSPNSQSKQVHDSTPSGQNYLPKNSQEIINRWDHFLIFLKNKNSFLENLLKDSRVMGIEGNIIYIHSTFLESNPKLLDQHRADLFNYSKAFFDRAFKFFVRVQNQPNREINKSDKGDEKFPPSDDDEISGINGDELRIRKKMIETLKLKKI